MALMWRTCQECGHVQSDNPPTGGRVTERYMERKCKKCRSQGSLDWGSAARPNREIKEETE